MLRYIPIAPPVISTGKGCFVDAGPQPVKYAWVVITILYLTEDAAVLHWHDSNHEQKSKHC